MKRIVALLLSALLMVVSVSAIGEVLSLTSSAAELKAHQTELDTFWKSIDAGAETGFASTGRFAEVKAMIEAGTPGDASQITMNGETIVIAGGLHFIEESGVISGIILENDAVLMNLRGTIGSVIAKDSSEYYGLEGSYVQQFSAEGNAHAYLYGAYGDRVTAEGNAEVSFLDRASIQEVILSGNATAALLGEAIVSGGYTKDNAVFFDPYARAASITQEGGQAETQQAAASPTQATDAFAPAAPTTAPVAAADPSPTAKTGGTGAKKTAATAAPAHVSPNGVPYPQNIVDWVFNSKPQAQPQQDSKSACGCGCDCGLPCALDFCCTKCTCMTIRIVPDP